MSVPLIILLGILQARAFADDGCAQAFAKLSGGEYCQGRHCVKALWLSRNAPHLAAAGNPSESVQFFSRQEQKVEKLARDFFVEGELIGADDKHWGKALEHTERALEGGARYLFKAAFEYDGIRVRPDVLKVHGPRDVNIIAVKSSNFVEESHADEVAVQKYVLENLGFKTEVHLLHLNRDYLRRGDLELERLFILKSMEGMIGSRFHWVEKNAALMRAKLREEGAPNEAIGRKCLGPYPCQFQEHCWRGVGKDSIHRLYKITDDQRCQLLRYGVHKLAEISVKKHIHMNGERRLQQIYMNEHKLIKPQKIQIQAAKTRRPVINLQKIREHLAGLEWPLYFLNFQTVSYAVPPHSQLLPYQQLPVSYSLHIQESPGAELKYLEFLHTQKGDPREELARELLRDIPSVDKGSVVVYHSSSESRVFKDLIATHPHFKALEDIFLRLWDLEVPFAKHWFYHQDFAGRSSLKYVLPVLAPRFGYDDQAILKGEVAKYRYMQILESEAESSGVREKVQSDLSSYGRRNTRAMVEILKGLMQAASP